VFYVPEILFQRSCFIDYVLEILFSKFQNVYSERFLEQIILTIMKDTKWASFKNYEVQLEIMGVQE